jgi:hypothetical protein
LTKQTGRSFGLLCRAFMNSTWVEYTKGKGTLQEIPN